LPDTQKVHEKVAAESRGQHLRDNVQVGDERRLEDDGDVRGVEELDGVASVVSSVSSRFDGKVDSKALEVDDDAKDQDGGEEVHDVRQVLSVERLSESSELVASGGQQVEESNDSALEFGTSSSVDGGGREGFPDDGFTDVCGDKQRDTRTESVAFLEEFVEQKYNQTSNKQLDDDEKADAHTHFAGDAVHTGHHVDDGLANSDDHTEELLSAREECSISGRVAYIDDFSASKQLHDQTGSDNW